MTSSNDKTSPSAITQPELWDETPVPTPQDVLALVFVWSAREPERVGETALFLPGCPLWYLGRAPSATENPQAPHEPEAQPVVFFRQRPLGAMDCGEPEAGNPNLLGESISRRQLELHPRTTALLVRNIGRCQMLINGIPASEYLLRPGDTLTLRNQLVLYCTRRPQKLPPLRAYPRERAPHFGQPDLDGIVGESPLAWQLRERLAACARTNLHALVTGESGTGKELASQAIHRMSARAGHKLIAENIAAIPPSLASAMLFGNRKNFPNPGMEERTGLIGAAHQSTLFLDEIGDMPEEVQPMFLRVTERSGEYSRLGEEGRVLRSDFRLIGATNRPHRMRHELKRRFQREVKLPGLNQRREDIPLLVNHLLVGLAQRDDLDVSRFLQNGRPQVHAQLIEMLLRHHYTTHVSEVAFLLGQAMSDSTGQVICPPADGFEVQPQAPRVELESMDSGRRHDSRKPLARPLPTRERAAQVLQEQGGDVTKAAAVLDISRDQLNRMIQREGLFIAKERRPRRISNESIPVIKTDDKDDSSKIA